MAEFNDPARDGYAAWEALPEGQKTYTQVESPPPAKPANIPQVTNINRALALLPLLALGILLVLLLAGCKSDQRPSTGTSSTTATQQQPGAANTLQGVVASVSTAVVSAVGIVATPGTSSGNYTTSVWRTVPPTPSPTPDNECSHVRLCGWDVLQGGAK